jgi:hypothetical protein
VAGAGADPPRVPASVAAGPGGGSGGLEREDGRGPRGGGTASA